jgi:tetratricopeptide (TPR) repeat protein
MREGNRSITTAIEKESDDKSPHSKVGALAVRRWRGKNGRMPDSPHEQRHSPRRRPVALISLLAGIAVLSIAIAAFVWPRTNPPKVANGEKSHVNGNGEKRPARPSAWDALVQASPYRNVRPGVKYVADAACVDCHAEIAEAYVAHPMGRSLGPTAQVESIERFTAEVRHPLKVDNLVYEVRRDGDHQFHRETRLSPEGNEALTTEFEAAYAVGSGRTGRSYIVERDAHLFMSPLTWYADHGWDLSPGYEVNNSNFNRPVVAECLFCHANQADHIAGTLNEYKSPIFAGHAIGCQRCHGPGELHVAAQLAGTADVERDLTIVNPADLAPALRESVCQQCHLGGLVRVETRGRRREDFRPGLPWHTVEAVYLSADAESTDGGSSKSDEPAKDVDRFVGHVEQMHTSGCYVGSNGKLGCISCHDPHGLPAESAKVEFYRQRCLQCHGEADCDLPAPERRKRQADDSCYACHMPQAATQIRHAAATDHRIPRAPDAPQRRPAIEPTPTWSPLLAFHALTGPHEAAPNEKPETTTGQRRADEDRNLAVALVRAMDRHPGVIDRALLPRMIELLEQAVKRDPTDVPARDAYAFALARSGDLRSALREMEAVLAREPKNETQLAATASMLMGAQDWAAAAMLWEQALGVNPWIVRYWSELALCYAHLGRWQDCSRVCEEALRRFPDSFRARQLLIESHLVSRRTAEAQREYERMLELNPPKIDSVRRWWEGHPLRK